MFYPDCWACCAFVISCCVDMSRSGWLAACWPIGAGPPARSGLPTMPVDSRAHTEMSRREKYREASSSSLLADTDPTKARVLQHLAEGRLIATRHHKVGLSGVSGVWTRFSRIVKPCSDEAVGFVQCNYCRAVLRYDSHRTGTSSLQRHRCARSHRPATSKDTLCCWLL
jgi:hypothetical protein